MLTKAGQQLPADSPSLCFMFLAASLFYGSLSSLTIMLEDSEKKACPAKTFAALPSAKSITLEGICMGLIFFAALPLPLGKSFALKHDASSDALAAVKAKIEGKEVDVIDTTKFDAMASKSAAQQKRRAMAAAAAAESELNQKWGGDGGTELDEAASQKRLLGGGDEVMDEPRFIFVKLPDSRLITVPFHPLKKLSDVKREVECRLRLDPGDYSLYINGRCKRLDKDNLSLSDYGIGKDSTLVANVPMRAGMVATRSVSGSSAVKGVETSAGVGVELEKASAEEVALPTDEEMGGVRGGSSGMTLRPSRRKVENRDIASPLRLGDGSERGWTRQGGGKPLSPAAER